MFIKILLVCLIFGTLFTEDISLQINTDKEQYRLGDEIILKVILENKGSKNITMKIPKVDHRSLFIGFKYAADTGKKRTYYSFPTLDFINKIKKIEDLDVFYKNNKIEREEQFIVKMGSYPIAEMLKPANLKEQILKPGEKTEDEIRLTAVRSGDCEITAYYAGLLENPNLWEFDNYIVSNSLKINIKGKELHAILETDIGSIEFRFRPDLALNHVHQFCRQASDGFYEKTYFHRIINGFMAQGGDNNTLDYDDSNDGMGNPGYMLPLEISREKHKEGTLSTARTALYNTAGSQFFICSPRHKREDGDRQDSLNNKYSIFGEMIMVDQNRKVLKNLCATQSDLQKDGKVLKKVYINSVKIKVIE
ncbi:MAG: peptidylprolyl isomerase [Candidatus Coatesbacteria bacterium]|nr:peptidylprolyl isomerase [Candidatus Coatesbacteria bacterium]